MNIYYFQIDESVLEKIAKNQTCIDCKLLVNCKESSMTCNSFFNGSNLSDHTVGGILLPFSIIVIFALLCIISRLLTCLFQSFAYPKVTKVLTNDFKKPIFNHLFGYICIFLGIISAYDTSGAFEVCMILFISIEIMNITSIYPYLVGYHFGKSVIMIISAFSMKSEDTYIHLLQVFYYQN